MSSNPVSLLAIELLQPNPFQPRSKIKPEDVSELTDSIKQYGILEPLVVAQTPAGYQIIAGERRWRAAKQAGLKEVPVTVIKTTPKGMLEMAIIENVQRLDLNAIERAQAFQQLIQEFHHTMDEIARKISKSSSYVSNTVRLLKLPDAVKDSLNTGVISEGHARALAGLSDVKLIIEIFKQILKENASVRRAEELVRSVNEKLALAAGKAPRSRNTKIDDPVIAAWQKNLENMLKCRSQIHLTRSSNQTRITITLRGDAQKTQADLDKIIALTQGKN